MKTWLIYLAFLAFDVLVFLSVPSHVRHENQWAMFPGGGYVLAIEYHFGNKLKEPTK